MQRVPPSERTREEIRHLVDHGSENPKSDLIKLAARRIVEETLEAEVRDALGKRGYYERRGEREGYRNGYRTGHMETAEGQIDYAVPQVRDMEFRSKVRARLAGRTQELEQLALEMYARGLSTRDIEDTFRDDQGRSILSRTAVSEVTEALWKEYEEFANRDLSEVKPYYLFMDGVAERLRPGSPREAVLVAWCINHEGRKILLHVAPGTKESTDTCVEFFEGLKRRGLRDPVLVATDGAPGLIVGVEKCFPASLRQRCLAHKMRNIDNKLPEEAKSEFKQAARAAYQAPSPEMARALRDDLKAKFARTYPSATACFEEDFEACIAHLRCPPGHRRVIRTTNLLERLFVEERRRTRAALHLFGERPVLKLMYGAMIRASDNWRGINISEFENRQLQSLAEQLVKAHRDRNSPAAKSQAHPPRISSTERT